MSIQAEDLIKIERYYDNNRLLIEKMAEMKEKAVMHADKLLELLETL